MPGGVFEIIFVLICVGLFARLFSPPGAKKSEIILFIFNILLNPIAVFYLVSPLVGEPLFFDSRLGEIGYVILHSLFSALMLGLLTIIILIIIQKHDFSLKRALKLQQ